MKRNWPLFVTAIFLAFLIAYRAYSLPITHDEASTWLNYRHLNVWSCMSNAVCWGTANNHWLNTLLLQWSAFFFGDVPWALRLPNVLAGFGYILCALLISGRYIENKILQFAGFVLICGHVYLLDFFSLARGYGLMASGVIWGIYGMLRYIEKYEWRWLVFASSALTFAVLGNFTALLPWAAIGMGWGLWLLLSKKFSLLFRHGLIWLVNAVILFILLRYPIKTLANSGEFSWGAKNIWEMSKDLIINLLYGERIFGEHSADYILIVLGILATIICSIGLLKKNINGRESIIFMCLLLFLNFFIILLYQKLTGSLAPVGRKSIYLIPFLFGFFALSLQFIKKTSLSIVIGILLSSVLLYRIPLTAHTGYCREWYFDVGYPELFASVLPKGGSSDSIRLSSSWIFNPSLTFYQRTIPFPLGGLPYQRPLEIDSTMDYYYIESSDSVGMDAKGFVLDKTIGPFFLFKNIHTDK